jgi:Cu(I)-responsive transcriptional regulator
MNISQAAQMSGLTSKALRYYESIELLTPGRASNGYREYSRQHVAILQFIHRARASGFSIEDVRELLQLYSNPSRRSHDAKLLVQEKLQQIEQQLTSLQEMQKSLRKLSDSCAGDDSPECGILDQLANGD